MVGFGAFLRRACNEHGVTNQAIGYDKLKAVVEALARQRASRPVPEALGGPGSPTSHRFSDGSPTSPTSQDQSDDGSRSPDEGTSGGGTTSGRASPSASAGVSSGPSGAGSTPPAASAPGGYSPRHFVEKLEEELKRVDDVVARKMSVLRRAHCIQETAKAVRERQLKQEHGVMLTQLVSVYDDVVLLLWFMYLNAIGASKIVKKYNKNVTDGDAYAVNPQQWIFLSSGLRGAQIAKAQLEDEYAASAFADSAIVRGGKGDLLTSSDEVRRLANGISALMNENRKHIQQDDDDPTEWACHPLLDVVGAVAGTSPDEAAKAETVKVPGSAKGRVVMPKREGFRFSVTDPQVLSEYQVNNMVGRGAYGVVSRVTHKEDKRTLALKTVRAAWSHPILAQRTYREVLIMQQMAHPHIVRLEDHIVDDKWRDVHLVMNFIPHTVEGLLSRQRLNSAHKQWFSAQLLDALAYMHGRGVVHRDLKPSNLLVDDAPNLFVTDFGLARTFRESGRGAKKGENWAAQDNPEYAQTQWYRAPEVLLCQQTCGGAADVWSVGCIVAEMLTGVPLLPGQDPQHQLELIIACVGAPGASLELARHQLQSGGGGRQPPEAPARSGSSVSPAVGGTRERTPDLAKGGKKKSCISGRIVPRPAPLPAARRGLEELLRCCWLAGRQADSASDYPLDDILDLLRRLLTYDPSARILARDGAEHAWFAQLQRARGYVMATEHGPVRLPLSCEEIHPTQDYCRSLSRLRRRALVHELGADAAAVVAAATTLQQWWRWRRRGAPRVPAAALRKRRTVATQHDRDAMRAALAAAPAPPTHRAAAPRAPPRPGGAAARGEVEPEKDVGCRLTCSVQ